MGYPDSYSTKRDPRTATVSIGVDNRRHINHPPRLAPDVTKFGQAVSERRSAVQYCISNDLI
jgi:hypothetical protein